MSLLTKVDTDLRDSQKSRDAVRTGTLRMLKTNLKNTAIAKRVSEDSFSDAEVIAVLRLEIKKRKEAVEAYGQGGRAELAEKEKAELAILEAYVPQGMGEAEVRALIAEVVSEQGLTPPYQFGSLMGPVVKKVAGRAEGAAVKAAVEAYISHSKAQ